VSPALPRFRMYVRPYGKQQHNGAMAFYWLTRVDAGGERVVDRGEGLAAKGRIERFVRRLAGGTSPDWVLAARARNTGWEVRR
jgi:hypothetical protein